MSKSLPNQQSRIGVNAVADALGIEWRAALKRVNQGEFGAVEEVRVGTRTFRLVDAARVRRAARKKTEAKSVAAAADGAVTS